MCFKSPALLDNHWVATLPRVLTSHQQRNNLSIIPTLLQHLASKRHLLVFPGSHQKRGSDMYLLSHFLEKNKPWSYSRWERGSFDPPLLTPGLLQSLSALLVPKGLSRFWTSSMSSLSSLPQLFHCLTTPGASFSCFFSLPSKLLLLFHLLTAFGRRR